MAVGEGDVGGGLGGGHLVTQEPTHLGLVDVSAMLAHPAVSDPALVQYLLPLGTGGAEPISYYCVAGGPASVAAGSRPGRRSPAELVDHGELARSDEWRDFSSCVIAWPEMLGPAVEPVEASPDPDSHQACLPCKMAT